MHELVGNLGDLRSGSELSQCASKPPAFVCGAGVMTMTGFDKAVANVMNRSYSMKVLEEASARCPTFRIGHAEDLH